MTHNALWVFTGSDRAGLVTGQSRGAYHSFPTPVSTFGNGIVNVELSKATSPATVDLALSQTQTRQLYVTALLRTYDRSAGHLTEDIQ
ncbi:hypothetical protein PsYK624_081340 [Phanerochaete sordida]|uniref:Uncharacterized protein n=1 Tax=Phanerochaete sordida TaxID=48140 RepID=A0A9P3GC00_9APHY|nr:hypothetical protein PsYK624_081340 [Phanerochaete sordida]